jgi:hypothetical protein
MGLNFATGALIAWAARERGLAANSVVTIGRLEVSMSASSQSRIHAFLGNKQLTTFPLGSPADPLLSTLLNSCSVESLDISDYQSASIVHNLNDPVPDTLINRFDMLVDGGSLEHVFNIPVALINYSKMVRPGGWVLITTTANNFMGHGFYQFSPELFFSYFSKANGYKLEYCGLAVQPYPSSTLSDRCEMYEVADPRVVKMRIGAVTSSPALLLVLARRLSITDSVSESAIQSDYLSLHEDVVSSGNSDAATRTSGLRKALVRFLPVWLVRYFRGLNELRWYSLKNRRAFRKHSLEQWSQG